MKKIYLLLLLAIFGTAVNAQVSTYTFSQSNGAYAPLVSPTVLALQTTTSGTANSALDDVNYTTALPFNFVYDGVTYPSGTTINVNTNGFISFGTAPITSNYTAISGSDNNTIALFSFDTNGGFGGTGTTTTASAVITNISNTAGYTVGAPITGAGIPAGATVVSVIANTSVTISAPATATGTGIALQCGSGQISAKQSGSLFTIEFRNMRRYNVNDNLLNGQIVLHQNTNGIDLIYGTIVNAVNTYGTQVGIRGGSAINFNNRTGTDWTTSSRGTANMDLMTLGSTGGATIPTSGFTYTFTPNLDAVDYCNLQSPATATVASGSNVTVYTQGYEPGVTEAIGPGAGIAAWIGYSATNTNPSTWTNWVPATFNIQSGNNDEFQAAIGSTLAPGTYYYASRWQLNGGTYKYGGYPSGLWDGTTNISGVLTVSPPGPPANDDCANAIALTVNTATTCTATTNGSTLSATQSTGTTPTCSNGFDDDVWYKFVASAATQTLTITGATVATVSQVYSGTCGSLVAVACGTTGSGGLVQTLTALVPNNTYYVRVFSSSSTTTVTSNFTICISTPPTPPVSDLCSGAIVIPAAGPFPYLTGATSNINATSPGDPVAPCQATTNRGIWYTFTPTVSGPFIFSSCQSNAPLSTVSDNVLSVFTSANGCTGPFTSLACDDDACTTLGNQAIVTATLASGTTYYILVYGYNANTGDVQLLITAPPTCTSINLPYTENFDAAIAPNLPSCTSVENTNGGNTWRTVSDNDDLPHTAPNFIRLDFETDNITPGNDWFFTQGLNLTGGTTYQLKFWVRNSDGTDYIEKLEVKYGTAATSAAMTSAAVYSNTNINSNVWSEVVTTFTPATTGAYYLGFHGFSDPGQAFLAVDDINLTVAPSCIQPGSITVSSITGTSASVSFTGTGSSYIAEVGATGFTPGTDNTPGTGGTVFTGTGSPISVTGLTAGTTYDVYVRQSCTANTYSANTKATFSTPISNDEPSGAITLTTNAGCSAAPYTNVNSTLSAGEVHPSCSQVAVAPVWFKFVATSSAVRVSTDYTGGTFDDSRVGLFSATDASNYSTFTLLSCDDDGGSDVNYASVLYATNLTPGNTYYIAVDKYGLGTTSGSFCITVDDLSSSMLATANTCASTYQTPAGSTTTYTGQVPLLDAASKLVAIVQNPAGGAVSAYSVAQNINTGAVRQDAAGKYYLDRNFRINNSSATNVTVQFFFTAAELAALTAADPTITLQTLGAFKQEGTTCNNDYIGTAGNGIALSQTAYGSQNSADWITVTTPSFSNFYLNKNATVLPISIEFFRGTKQNGTNVLDWKVNCTATPSVTITLERSGDSRTFSAISAISATSVRCLQPFNYNDANANTPVSYYRLKLVDADGRITYSQVVALLNSVKGFELVNVLPNPVKGTGTLNISSAVAGKMDIMVTDVVGKLISKQTISLIAGNNQVPMMFTKLAAGSYQITGKMADGSMKTIRFVKE